MSAVIFGPAASPTLEEYFQAVAGKPLDEQESLLKDTVTMECCSRNLAVNGDNSSESGTVEGSTLWPPPLSRALIPCSLHQIELKP